MLLMANGGQRSGRVGMYGLTLFVVALALVLVMVVTIGL